MLWSEGQERAKQLRGCGRDDRVLVSEIICAWLDSDDTVARLLRERSLDRDDFVQRLARLEYDAKQDRPVADAIRALPAPVSVEAVVAQMARRFETHPAVQLLAEGFACPPAGLIQALQLQESAPPAVAAGAQTNLLLTLGTDLTERARAGEFQCLIPGEATDALERALVKVRRQNAILTGDAGSGKTSTVHALAHRIVTGRAHPRLKDVRIVELSAGALVANTKYRGELAERFRAVVKEVGADASRKTILFVDEIHALCGLGRTEGSQHSISDDLKPVLASGQLHVIGATTDGEYRHIEADRAFARRFERIRVTPATGEGLAAMIRKQADVLAEKHAVAIPESIRLAATGLADRYCANRAAQPDRTLDLLDSACTLVAPASTLGREHVIATLSHTTGLPSDLFQERGVAARLPGAREAMSATVFNQGPAIEAVLSRLASNPFRNGAERRPLASFLFLGESGVGKTLLAESLAASLFGRADALLRIDCGELAEGGLAKLLGAPLGAGPAAESGVLSDFLCGHPMGVLLFDEVEKAFGTVADLLLGILDKGEVRGGDGRLYTARSCVVVATTNAVVGSDLRNGGGMGFGHAVHDGQPTRQALARRLKTHFRVELLNRFDDLLLFAPLDPEGALRILKRSLAPAMEPARPAGGAMPDDASLRALLAANADAIAAEGGRAIERLAAEVIRSLPDVRETIDRQRKTPVALLL